MSRNTIAKKYTGTSLAAMLTVNDFECKHVLELELVIAASEAIQRWIMA